MANAQPYLKFGNGSARLNTSMLEIEKKYRLSDERRDLIVASLKAAGAVFEREDEEENTIYNGNVLAETGAIVRIRRTATHSVLTYKRRIEGLSAVKRQIEYETEISDPDAADKIVRGLSLTPRLVYEKRRRIWKFRKVEVVIDELPFGLFMEIEGSVSSIKEVEMLLDIEDLEAELDTYPRLTERLGKNVGGVIEARF